MCFATARFIGAPVGSYAEFRDWIVEHRESVVRVILARSTQTNETARCAVLLAVLEQLDGPLSLIDRVQVDAPRHATSGRRVGTLVSSIMQGGSTGHVDIECYGIEYDRMEHECIEQFEPDCVS